MIQGTITFDELELQIIQEEIGKALRGIHKPERKMTCSYYGLKCPAHHFRSPKIATSMLSILKKVEEASGS